MTYEVAERQEKDFLLNVKTYFNQKNNHIIYDKRNIIKIVEFEEKKYVVKSFKIPHLLNQIVYRFFRDSKAKRSFKNSFKLKELGINTPRPIGYIEFPTAFRFKESFYISEFFDFDFEIRAVLSDKNFEDRENILKAFVSFSYNLHNKGVFHIDYSPGNILVKKESDGYIFSLIDVNRMQFLEFTDELRMKAFAKLSASEDDRVFITKEYCQLANIELTFATTKMELFHKEHQQYIENKKKLRKLKKRKS